MYSMFSWVGYDSILKKGDIMQTKQQNYIKKTYSYASPDGTLSPYYVFMKGEHETSTFTRVFVYIHGLISNIDVFVQANSSMTSTS